MKIENKTKKKSSAVDMTVGGISKHLIFFALPLVLGNLFQLFYNTVDTLVVGNFVGKEALAAVGATASVINIAIFFFSGLSTGVTVVISRYYGAKDREMLHRSVETTMMVTIIGSILVSIIGYATVPQMLRFMSTPEDVIPEAGLYLHIYFAGISGLLIYNMCSAILRAVGDTRHPLVFLVVTSLVNIALDLLFVLGLRQGIAGVAYATIISQWISAGMVIWLLTTTDDIYHLSWRELGLDQGVLMQMLAVGLPAGIQTTITSISNVFVQGYINRFGSVAMAGWSCFSKMEQFIFLPMQSMAVASTTFVGQNIGAGHHERAERGTWRAIGLTLLMTAFSATVLFVLAVPVIGIFSSDAAVIADGVLFMRASVYFALFNSVNHVLAGALRGRGDAKGPMIIMMLCFVVLRQIYLYVGSSLSDSIYIPALGYPVGWTSCCIVELLYYHLKYRRPGTSD